MTENNSGTKTEEATPKRLQKARRHGDIAKSQDVTNVILLLLAFLLLWSIGTYAGNRLMVFLSTTLADSGGAAETTEAFISTVAVVGTEALSLLFGLSALLIIPTVIVGLLIEFLQVGPVFTFHKLSPKLSNLNPTSGCERMFSMDSLVELLKSLAKALVILGIGIYTAVSVLPDLLHLPSSRPAQMGIFFEAELKMLLSSTIAIFLLVAGMDFFYQRHSHAEKMKMSIEDIRQEQKSYEGDPHVKGQRQQLAREWAQEGATNKAREATVLVVNPTHVAIALQYNSVSTPVPRVTARGVDEIALAMRNAAQEEGVPVVRNIRLARQLLRETDNGDPVPIELFDIVAEIILWAQKSTQSARHDSEFRI